MSDSDRRFVAVGRISGVFGVQGWLRVYSYTSPRLNIVNYNPWYLRSGPERVRHALLEGRAHGEGVIARLGGVDDRDAAATLQGAEIEVERAQLGAPAADEYFWTDLEGMAVVNAEGCTLGVIDHLFETGANDVMVVMGDRRRLIPFVRGAVVLDVDMARRRLTVDWHEDD